MDKSSFSLSPSRISDFQQCPQLYKYRAIDKLPERPGIDALRGSIVHLILEDLFKLETSKRDFESITRKIPEYITKALSEDVNNYCAIDSSLNFPLTSIPSIDENKITQLSKEIKTLVANYFLLEDPTKIQPKSTEELLEYNLDDSIFLKGYVDRIDVSPKGWIRINDYKTGKSPKENFESKVLFQLKFYALIIYKQTKEIAKQLRLIYLKDSKIISYEPSLEDIQTTEQKVRFVAEQIDSSIKTNSFSPKISKLCDYCYFKSICPAFN